ncbi:MAG: putative quinol monooxygenase [Acidimicrobiales bacterium]
MSKTAVLAKLPIKPDAKDTFLDAFGAMLDAVESEAGTEIYILNWGQNDDENTAYIYELYADGDALAVHSGSDAMKALMGALGGVMAGAPELVMLTPAVGPISTGSSRRTGRRRLRTPDRSTRSSSSVQPCLRRGVSALHWPERIRSP